MRDKIILGHNQFFGVNHLAAETGNQKEAYFSDISRIMDIINFAFDQEVRGLMMSTHERALLVSKAIRCNPRLKDELGIYLLVPYAAKYIKQANEKGLVNVIREALGNTTLYKKLAMFMRGGMGLLNKDIKKVLTAMIDFEVASFGNLHLQAVILHDVITDLILGWDVPEIFEIFSAHIKDKYKAIPAFCTKNLPCLMLSLNRTNIRNPLIMASINKLGFQVNPSREAFEACLLTHELQLIAMSTLASGFLKPKEAYDYLFSLPRVDSVVVGVSSTNHAEETFNEIRRQMAKRPIGPRMTQKAGSQLEEINA